MISFEEYFLSNKILRYLMLKHTSHAKCPEIITITFQAGQHQPTGG